MMKRLLIAWIWLGWVCSSVVAVWSEDVTRATCEIVNKGVVSRAAECSANRPYIVKWNVTVTEYDQVYPGIAQLGYSTCQDSLRTLNDAELVADSYSVGSKEVCYTYNGAVFFHSPDSRTSLILGLTLGIGIPLLLICFVIVCAICLPAFILCCMLSLLAFGGGLSAVTGLIFGVGTAATIGVAGAATAVGGSVAITKDSLSDPSFGGTETFAVDQKDPVEYDEYFVI